MMHKIIPMESRSVQLSPGMSMWKWNSVVNSVQCVAQRENGCDV